MPLPFLARLVCWVISLHFLINPHHGPGRGTGVPTLQTKRRRLREVLWLTGGHAAGGRLCLGLGPFIRLFSPPTNQRKVCVCC